MKRAPQTLWRGRRRHTHARREARCGMSPARPSGGQISARFVLRAILCGALLGEGGATIKGNT
eukprot:12346087-Alexandrium_andersonii.AAC.1